MEINQAGIDLIKSFEQCRLTVYKDIVGLNTVGWGHRTDLDVGTEISQDEADQLLIDDLCAFNEGVTNLVKVQIEPNQFSALVCFAYNCGLGALKQSTLLRCVNMNNWNDAAAEFLKWDRAGGKVVPGLTRRREAEAALFKQ